MPRPLRLLFCIKAMNNPGGGAERVLADVARGLADRGHDVSVLTFEPPGGRSFYPLGEAVGRIELGIGSTTGRATVGATLRRMAALRQRVVAHRPQVAIGFMHSMFLPLGAALAGSGIPVIASEHIVPEHYRSRPLQALLLRAAPLVVDRMTCVSEQVKSKYPPALRRLIDVVPNPLTLTSSGRADVAPPQRPNILLTVGRLTAQKDHETLIRAFALVAPKTPGWKLRIVGDGELRASLEELVHSLGLVERVELPGSIADIASEYLAAQLYVTPSRYESFGLATAEALAYGLPAVGFGDCPGTNELIEDGVNGRLVAGEADRPSALSQALRELMLDPVRRQRLAAGGGAMQSRFSIDAVLDAWEDLFERTLSASTSRRST